MSGIVSSMMKAAHAPIYDARLRALVAAIVPHLRPNDRVLDVGCGVGTLGKAIMDSPDCPDGSSELTVSVTCGESYLVRVGGFNDDQGSGMLTIGCLGQCGTACTGDVNGDSVVDVQDLTSVILDWGTDGSANQGDVDGNGIVDVQDLSLVILNFGPCP